MRRYYALQLSAGSKLQLVRALDNKVEVLAESAMHWTHDQTYNFCLEVEGKNLRGFVDGALALTVEDAALPCGGIALLIEEGRTETQKVTVSAV